MKLTNGSKAKGPSVLQIASVIRLLRRGHSKQAPSESPFPEGEIKNRYLQFGFGNESPISLVSIDILLNLYAVKEREINTRFDII